MKRLLVCLSLLITCIATNSNASRAAETVIPFDLRDHPVYLMASYYNAIMLKDYTRAYNYWNGRSPLTFDEFTAGMANTDTESIRVLARLPIRYGAAAGTSHAEVPIMLFSKLRTGEQQIFAGCVHTASPNVPTGSEEALHPVWYIDSASFKPASGIDFVQAARECKSFIESFPLDAAFDNRVHPLLLIESYYSALANRNYNRAYNYWSHGAPDQTLAEFSQGFAGTSEIGVVVALNFTVEGAAGSMFASTPVLLTSKDNGVSQLFSGCLVTRKSNVPAGNATEPDPNWSLSSARVHGVAILAEGVEDAWTVCNGV